MTNAERDWSRSELERYLDGDLEACEQAALSEALRASPELRAMLDDVRRCDGAIRAALRAAPARRPHRRPWRWRLMAGSLAGVALVVLGLLLWWPSGAASPAVVAPEVAMLEPLPEGPVSSGRVVEVLRLPPVAREALASRVEERGRAPSAASEAPAARDVRGLKRSLAHGDVSDALRMIEEADGEDRREACRVIGHALASAWTAERVLDGLSSRDQLEVCRAWATEQRFLVETFDRLAVLAHDPTIREEFAEVIRELAAESELRGWMRKSGLAGLADAGGPVS